MASQLTLIAKLTAKPGTVDALGRGLQDLIEPTLAEPGCLGYLLHHDISDPNVWVLYETWLSRADLNAHFEKPYTKPLMSRFPWS